MSQFDFGDLPLHMELKHAEHGDLRPLVKLLRSKRPLPKSIRDYLADELEKHPDKRFRQRLKGDLGTLKRRQRMIKMVELAKFAIAGMTLSDQPTPDELGAAVDALPGITDKQAISYLAERGVVIEPDDLANARRAIGPSLSSPPRTKRKPHVS